MMAEHTKYPSPTWQIPRLVVAFLLIIGLTAAISEPVLASPDPSWLSDWAKRIELTIDHNDIDATLSHFPVLVYLSSNSGTGGTDVTCIFDEIGSDSKKIAVTKSDGTTQLYVEIEKWDSGNEKAWLWVSRSGWSISSTVDTIIYLYYDSSQPNNTTYVGDPSDAVVHNVWDANHKLVTHMRDDPDTSHVRDSTVNANDGTKRGAGEPAVTTLGKIDDAQDFDGANDRVNCPALNVSHITAEVWIYPHGWGETWGRAFDKTSSYIAHVGASNEQFFTSAVYVGATGHYVRDPLGPPFNQWYHYVMTYDGETLILYKDGASIDTETAPSGNIDSNANILCIGNRPAEDRTFDGVIDEFRISDTARSAAWVKASYESGRDDLMAFGSEESANVAPNIPTNLQPSARQITTNVTISCDVTDNDGDQMNVHFYDNSDNSLIDNIWADNGTTASVTWGSLTRGNTYTFFAGAQDNNGNWGENSATQSFMVNSLPTIPTNFTNLGMNLTNHSPTITWTEGTDADGDTVTTYIFLGTTSTPTEIDGSTTEETFDLGENVSHSTYPLADGSTYYYRLRSWDGYEWSTDYTTADEFRMNTPPTTPTNLQPAGVQTTTSVTISCVGTDNDGDNMNVHFYDNSDNSLIDNIWIENGQTAQVAWDGLVHGLMYVFFAGAQDVAGEWGENSDTQSFWVILHGPELDKPIENQPYFEWSDSYADNYRLLVDNNQDFSSPVEDRILFENHYQIPPENALDNGVYYWKVIAYFDGEEVESDVWSFVVGAVGEIVEEPAKPILDPMFLLVLSIVLMTTALSLDSTVFAFFGGVSALFVGFMFLDTLWFAMIMIGLGIYFILTSVLSEGGD